MYRLDNSACPRTGYDIRNSSNAKVSGPKKGIVKNTFPLYVEKNVRPNKKERKCGIVTQSNGNIIISNNSNLYCLTLDGTIIWRKTLLEPNGEKIISHSSPLALADGYIAINTRRSLIIYNSLGDIIEQIPCYLYDLDDSNYSPNITNNGEIVVSCIDGDILMLCDSEMVKIGCYGYDVPPPSVYSDDTLAISGYRYMGFCKTAADGEVLWKSDLKDADLLNCINSSGYCAVGSKNDDKSCVYSSDGTKVAEYKSASLFAEYIDNGWIAANGSINRLDKYCNTIWSFNLDASYLLPTVDANKDIYITTSNGIACLDKDGNILFNLDLGGEPNAYAIVANGVIAALIDNKIFVIE